jgi:hypothetical protein
MNLFKRLERPECCAYDRIRSGDYNDARKSFIDSHIGTPYYPRTLTAGLAGICLPISPAERRSRKL